jgi:hypothetical protein
MLGEVISEILGKMKITLKEKMYVGTFIISILIFRTFSIATLSLTSEGDNPKTKRNKAYEFLRKKLSYIGIFGIIISETALKKTYIVLLLLIIRGYWAKEFFSLLFLIRKERYRLLSR